MPSKKEQKSYYGVNSRKAIRTINRRQGHTLPFCLRQKMLSAKIQEPETLANYFAKMYIIKKGNYIRPHMHTIIVYIS